MEKEQFCGFKIGEDEYGIRVQDVQEVIRSQGVTHVPLAPKEISGLINLRGQIVTCMNLRQMFGAGQEFSKEHMNIIIKGDGALFSLMVDQITDIVDVDLAKLEPTPDTICPKLRFFVRGVFQKSKGLLIVLDTKSLISFDEKGAKSVAVA